MKHWVITLEQDGEDLILPLPPDLLEETGWRPNDVLEWIDNHDGSWTLKKKYASKEDVVREVIEAIEQMNITHGICTTFDASQRDSVIHQVVQQLKQKYLTSDANS